MEREEQRMLGRKEQATLVAKLHDLFLHCQVKNWDRYCRVVGEAISQANLGLEPENLEEIRTLMKVVYGQDPLARDTHPKGEKQPGLTRSKAEGPPSLQDLRRRIYMAAKAEPTKRFWGLYVHVCKTETLRAAYRDAKENRGAPGIDGVTFEDIEASGTEAFLEQIRDELVQGTYMPMRTRKVEIPKDGGKKTRTLSIPSIRDRIVQGAVKLILEAIFEADFQPGSYGYRPKRTGHEAVERVARGIAEWKTRVIDLDLSAFFDNVRHHILLEKVAKRVDDPKIMSLLKLILRSSGKMGVPQGGVISPLLSNIYLNEVDKMLEKAKEVTRDGKHTAIEYARWADDLVVLIDHKPQNDWLMEAIPRRLREEFGKLQVKVNEEKSRVVDMKGGGSFGFLGFQFFRARSRKGNWCPIYIPKPKKRKEVMKELKDKFHKLRSSPVTKLIQTINSIIRGWVNYFRIGNSARCLQFIRAWVEKKIRRHLERKRKRRGFGWKKRNSRWLYEKLGLFDDYIVKWFKLPAKDANPFQ